LFVWPTKLWFCLCRIFGILMQNPTWCMESTKLTCRIKRIITQNHGFVHNVHFSTFLLICIDPHSTTSWFVFCKKISNAHIVIVVVRFLFKANKSSVNLHTFLQYIGQLGHYWSLVQCWNSTELVKMACRISISVAQNFWNYCAEFYKSYYFEAKSLHILDALTNNQKA